MNVFHFTNYRLYLKYIFPVKGVKRGQRAKLAKALRVQNAFISRVLAGHSDFSLEQAVEINLHLLHSPDEADYFILLLLYAKAGTPNLKNFFMQKIESIQKKYDNVSTHVIQSEQLSLENQTIYYSNWIYSFLHLAFRIPAYQKLETWIQNFPLPLKTIKEAIHWMAQAKLIEPKGDRWVSTLNFMHLAHGSPLLANFHSQWRRQALNQYDAQNESDLFFTSPMTISRDDFKKIKTLILESIARADQIISPSKDEVMACLNIDLFKVN